MTISSMTGFGRSEGTSGNLSWQWELKTVNGRNLDIRFRAPGGFEWLDQELRKQLSGKIKRGSLQVHFQYKRHDETGEVSVNRDILRQVLTAGREIAEQEGLEPPTTDGLLRLKGVVELQDVEETEEQQAAKKAEIVKTLVEAVDRLAASRKDEGKRMADVLDAHVSSIEALTAKARQAADARPASIEQRFRDQLQAVLSETALSEDRILQEVAVLLTKADVTEELNRLSAHVASARDLLQAKEPVGRKLDFLTQEFNREANTLCSKSADIALTQVGLDLKVEIDQFKEQIQNIE